MKTESSREMIRDFVRTGLAKRKEHAGTGDHDNLIVNGVLDSIGLIKLIGFLEEKFRVSVEDDDVVPDHFESIDALTAFVDRLVEKRASREGLAK